MYEKPVVLVAIDMNAGSSMVLTRGLEMASVRRGGELHVLTVVEPRAPVTAVAGGVGPLGVEVLDPKELVAFCTRRMEAFRSDNPTVIMPSVCVHTALGSPPDEIVWLAAHVDADAIVLGTHGRRGLRRLLLGSVAEKVVRLAGCPVIIVREKNHRSDWKVSEIEPVCNDCARGRVESGGHELVCDRHRARYVKVELPGERPPKELPVLKRGIKS